MQSDPLVLVALCGFAAVFLILGALLYFYGWRLLTFGLIGGAVARLLGGRYHDTQEPEEAETGAVLTPRLDAQTAVEELPDFHATVAKYRSQETPTARDVQGTTANGEPDVTFTVEPGPNPRKDYYGVRYSGDRPNRVLRDRRYKRVRGPDSGDDPDVYPGMFENEGD